MKKTSNKIEYADLLFGVDCATSAGPTLPAGSIHPSPETLRKDCGGYARNQPIVGFGQAYTSGAGGKKCYGNFLLAPMLGNIELERANRASFAVEESAKCYEYSVRLENGIKTKLTPAKNAAIYSVEYPEGEEASLLIDVAHKLDIDAAMRGGSVSVDPANKRISGGGLYFGNWSGIDWEMYFSLEFDTDFEEIGVISDDTRVVCGNEILTVDAIEEKRLCAYIKFGKKSPRNVKVKIAISFVSTEKAAEFLHEQIPAFDYEAVKEHAKLEWSKIFDSVAIKTDDHALLRRFYTAMYHMHVQPRDRTDDHGTWDDFHTVWDTWKTTFPLYSLLWPEKLGTIVDSFIDRAEKNALDGSDIVLAECYDSAKEYLAGQGGNDTDNVIADTIIKNIELKKHTPEEAYNVLLQSAEKMRSKEYIEKGHATANAVAAGGALYSKRFKAGSATLGFALNDRAIANAAAHLGKAEDAEKYLNRSKNWLNAWNKEVFCEGFYGFPQNPKEDGTFEDGFDPHSGYNTDFYEASSWDASYMNYNDTATLVEVMGGKEIFIRRLMHACENTMDLNTGEQISKGYLNFTNEPSFHIPWLFCIDEIKRPDLAAKVINGVIKAFSLDDGYPGDEDNGAMSSYYIFMMCGLFPFSTTENYYLHGTRFEKTVLRLGSGKEFIITGENVGGDNIYVQSATLNGKDYNSCKITHSQIICGGTLHFVMGDKPSEWAKQ